MSETKGHTWLRKGRGSRISDEDYGNKSLRLALEAIRDAAFRAGLEAAAQYMLARKVTASEFYAAEIRKLPATGEGE